MERNPCLPVPDLPPQLLVSGAGRAGFPEARQRGLGGDQARPLPPGRAVSTIVEYNGEQPMILYQLFHALKIPMETVQRVFITDN